MSLWATWILKGFRMPEMFLYMPFMYGMVAVVVRVALWFVLVVAIGRWVSRRMKSALKLFFDRERFIRSVDSTAKLSTPERDWQKPHNKTVWTHAGEEETWCKQSHCWTTSTYDTHPIRLHYHISHLPMKCTAIEYICLFIRICFNRYHTNKPRIFLN